MEHSSFGRLLGVLLSPRKTFQSIAERPTWLVAMLAVVLAAGGVGVLVMLKIDMSAELERQLQASGAELPEDQLEMMVGIQKVVGTVAGFIGAAVAYLVVALVLMGAFRLVGGDFDFKRSLSVTLHAAVPGAIRGALTAVVLYGRESIELEQVQSGTILASNLAFLAPEGTSRPLLAVLASVDLFSLWTLALLILGYRTIARVDTRRAAAVVASAWAILVLVSFGFAFLGPETP